MEKHEVCKCNCYAASQSVIANPEKNVEVVRFSPYYKVIDKRGHVKRVAFNVEANVRLRFDVQEAGRVSVKQKTIRSADSLCVKCKFKQVCYPAFYLECIQLEQK